MSKITAYKSDQDGKIFEHFKDYNAHLRKLAKYEKAQKLIKEQKKQKNDLIKKMFAEVSSPDELVKFLMENQSKILNLSALIVDNKQDKTSSQIEVIEKLRFCKNNFSSGQYTKEFKTQERFASNNQLDWSDEISNSHSAPIGKKTNWGGQERGEPRNYPGWKGVILYSTVKGLSFSFSSKIFEQTGINTGTGGGGVISQYELSIFAHDFRKMAYCEMLKDMEINKSKVSAKRIKNVLDLYLDSFDFNEPRFVKYIQELSVSALNSKRDEQEYRDISAMLLKSSISRDGVNLTKKPLKIL